MTTTTRVYTGVNHAELCEVLEEWAAAVEATPTALLNLAEIADAAAGFADSLDNLDPRNPCDRDVLTADEHAVEAGLCPDSRDHLARDCHRHLCPTYVQELSDAHPWVPVAELGRYV